MLGPDEHDSGLRPLRGRRGDVMAYTAVMVGDSCRVVLAAAFGSPRYRVCQFGGEMTLGCTDMVANYSLATPET